MRERWREREIERRARRCALCLQGMAVTMRCEMAHILLHLVAAAEDICPSLFLVSSFLSSYPAHCHQDEHAKLASRVVDAADCRRTRRKEPLQRHNVSGRFQRLFSNILCHIFFVSVCFSFLSVYQWAVSFRVPVGCSQGAAVAPPVDCRLPSFQLQLTASTVLPQISAPRPRTTLAFCRRRALRAAATLSS